MELFHELHLRAGNGDHLAPAEPIDGFFWGHAHEQNEAGATDQVRGRGCVASKLRWRRLRTAVRLVSTTPRATMTKEERWFPTLKDDVLQLAARPAPQRLDGTTYDLHGPEEGRPCIWFYGSPSGRLEALLLYELAYRRGHRFLCIDRPGVGGAAYTPGWTMLDHIRAAVKVADHLQWEKFSVAGGSGGGPYVLAAASFAPHRIDRAVSLACAGAFEHDDLRARAGWVDRIAAWGVRTGLIKPAFGVGLPLMARLPSAAAELGGHLFAPTGHRPIARLLVATLKESLRNGTNGLIRDTEVLHQAWGFSLASIQTKVTLVNGTKDPFIPLAYGTAFAKRIPQARLFLAEGDDHFKTIFDLERLDRYLQG